MCDGGARWGTRSHLARTPGRRFSSVRLWSSCVRVRTEACETRRAHHLISGSPQSVFLWRQELAEGTWRLLPHLAAASFPTLYSYPLRSIGRHHLRAGLPCNYTHGILGSPQVTLPLRDLPEAHLCLRSKSQIPISRVKPDNGFFFLQTKHNHVVIRGDHDLIAAPGCLKHDRVV